jgi:hypothetical protein
VRKLIAAGIVLFTIILCVLAYFVFTSKRAGKPVRVISKADNSDSHYRVILETAYPEFKDFENQNSFAGQKVKFVRRGPDRYYAYMVLGSGLPIIRATCFRVDKAGNVFKAGTFPDPADAYLGYSDIDPCNCRGIK